MLGMKLEQGKRPMQRRMFSAGFLAMALTAVVACAQVKVEDEPEPTDFRTWTDISGKFTLEAAMVKFADGKVHLQKKDGTVTRILDRQTEQGRSEVRA